MKAVWLNGWGLGAGYLEKLATNMYPNIEHKIILPKEGWENQLKHQSKTSTVIAYSFGAFLLLNRPDLCRKFNRVIFMAPFEDFKKESGRGGKTHLGQLRYLRRWLRRDKIAAIKDFVVRAGLNNCSGDLEGLHDADFVWGIDRLIEDSVEVGRLKGREAWIGGKDRLLDANRINDMYPNVNVLVETGHGLEELLEGAKIEL